MVPYPQGEAPSQRFRFEHYLKFMEQSDLKCDFQPFVSTKSWEKIYSEQHNWSKLKILISGLLNRFVLLWHIKKYDFIFIHRELTPLGPPVFEWIIAKILKKKIIYDFDDAIWLPDQNKENLVWKWLKWRSKVSLICKWSWKVSVGNDYLADYARKLNAKVVVFPTVVNTEMHKPKGQRPKANNRRPIIGWTGSHSTLFYLNMLIPALKALEEEIDFEFRVIANRDPKLNLKNFTFIKWNKTTEIEDLSQFDIGIMPLQDNEWAKGKCGFKLTQYLSMGIPAIASPVGVNKEIIQSEVTGYFAQSKDEWIKHLKILLQNHAMRIDMGRSGQKFISDNYSLKSQKEKFLSLFEV